MDKSNQGSCLCNEVSFIIEGSFDNFFLCHCKFCQKDTGSAHAANLFSTQAKIKWLSGEDKRKTFTLPSTKHVKSFCSVCGSALPSEQMQGKLIVVPAGSLDTKLSLKPNAQIFISSMAAWYENLDKIPKLDKLPS